MDKYIATALDAGHQLALSSTIPQSTRKSELLAFQRELAESKAIVEKKFGYELEGLYNFDKMSLMSSVEKAAKNVGFEVFARSFRVNLMNLDSLQDQAKLATQSGTVKSLVVQATIKEQADVLRLDDFVKEFTKSGYCVEGLHENSLESLHTSEFVQSFDVSKMPKNRDAKKQRGRSNKKNSIVSKKLKAKDSKPAPISGNTGSACRRALALTLHEGLVASLVQA